jgi:hypothetical protein
MPERRKEIKMERMKTGKAAKDIFAPTVAQIGRTAPTLSPGRRPLHTEEWTKVTVVLLNRQIVYLDRLAADIRAKTGAAIKRAEIIRALIDALAASDLDLTAAESEEKLKTILTTRLGH